ncbi:hypothetical protein DACRYDRAFT_114650 [Dacryopinax primogenitus]|uniref:Telomere replication protein EST3 n=1 Tax=Dacryopinax primogenitus (strain DJM 731) TaxID=1858805 RepID=M5G6H9_DACPD|nr:uncharacterized protein DACRYDRAFT_114650 [Dacryopinax primogenitus]EJU04299.1 hypothetical protein DACRYDRAFT_114650 [Dacryopinax primogenitus]
MSEVLRPWLLKHFQRLVEQDGPNDAFEEVRKKVQITKFHTDGAQPVKSGELWAQVSDKERWVDVLICPSSVEKHKTTHNGERITQVRHGNFFITKCRPIISQIPVFYNGTWSLSSPNLCLEAEVDFIGGRGCSSVHGDPVQITRDANIKLWESKLRVRGFTPAAKANNASGAPAVDSPVPPSADGTTSERQTTSPRSSTAVAEIGPWQAHLLRWWGAATEPKWPSDRMSRDQGQALGKIDSRPRNVSAMLAEDANGPTKARDPAPVDDVHETQDPIPWSPSPPRDRNSHHQNESAKAHTQEPDEQNHESADQPSQAHDGVGEEEEDEEEEEEEEEKEEEENEGEEDIDDSDDEDSDQGLAWEKDQDDDGAPSGAQTPASLDSVEGVLGTQRSDDDDSSAEPRTPFLPSSSVPATPLYIAAELSPSTIRSSGDTESCAPAPMQKSSPASASSIRGRASSSQPEQNTKQSTIVRAGTLPPRYSQVVSGQHDPESWTQPAFMRHAKSVSIETTHSMRSPSDRSRSGPSSAARRVDTADVHFRDEHDRQGFLSAGLGTQQDWEREQRALQGEEQEVVLEHAPKAILRSEFRSDPNARQGLQDKIKEASEVLRNGKRRAGEEHHEAVTTKRQRTSDNAPSTSEASTRPIHRSHASAPINASTSRSTTQKTAGTPTILPARDVFNAPTVTGDQIPLVRAALTSLPPRGKAKRTSPFDSDSDSHSNGETARKRSKREAERAEARFRFAKAGQGSRHVSHLHGKVSQAEIAHEVSAGLGRTITDVQREEEEELPSLPARSSTERPAANRSRNAAASPPSNPPPRPISTPPGPSRRTQLGVKLSPVQVEHVHLLGKLPRPKTALESTETARVIQEAVVLPSIPVAVVEPTDVPPGELMDTEMTTIVDGDPIPPHEPEPVPLAPTVPETSNNVINFIPTTVPLLGGFKPRFTLDLQDTALCLTVKDIGLILREIDEFRAHGY